MKNFSQSGNILDLTAPSGGVVSGAFYKIGQLLVCSAHDAAEATTFQGIVTGVISPAPKTTSQAWSEGALLYWDDSGKKFTTTSTGNLLAGCAASVAGSADATGTVRLNGTAGPNAS